MRYYEEEYIAPEDMHDVFQDERVSLEEISDLEYAREKMQVILDSLYGEKPLNDMQDAIYEMCGALDVPTPKNELNIQKKEDEYFKLGKYLMKNQATLY